MGVVACGEARSLGYYSVAKDFVTWFTNTEYLYINDFPCSDHRDAGSDESGTRGSNSRTRAWELYRYAMHKLKRVKYARIARAHCHIQLGQVIESIAFPNLKKLELMGVYLDENVELNAKVPAFSFCLFLSAKEGRKGIRTFQEANFFLLEIGAPYRIIYASSSL